MGEVCPPSLFFISHVRNLKSMPKKILSYRYNTDLQVNASTNSGEDAPPWVPSTEGDVLIDLANSVVATFFKFKWNK